MHVDVLVAEIGSTTTLVNAFSSLESAPRWLGQGQAPTSVLQGDVCLGLNQARRDLARQLGDPDAELTCTNFLASSSAAGGLGMTVHGLVHDMTVKAAQAAALGAGAVLRLTTAGRLSEFDVQDILEAQPKLIILAGGTDYGERETALYNAGILARLPLQVPVIYAGNIQNRRAVRALFAEQGREVLVTENVYPQLDRLNIEPARQLIQQAFEENIVKAPGMENIRTLVNGNIMPTPGAVMQAARVLYEDMGDLAVFDVGGATTDVHSVSEGSEAISLIATAPEPKAKRTVEGDLGVFVNSGNVLDMCGRAKVAAELGVPSDALDELVCPIPQEELSLRLSGIMARQAALTALKRHVGSLRYVYTPQGRRTLAEGKDLSCLKYIIATGGALTRLPARRQIMQELADFNNSGLYLYPKPGQLQILYDNQYLMASLGVLSLLHPDAALSLMKTSFME